MCLMLYIEYVERWYTFFTQECVQVIVQHLSQVGGDEEPQYQSQGDTNTDCSLLQYPYHDLTT